MAEVLFFQKPNDPANTKQKAQLEAAGHTVDARDLLFEPWTPETLRSWFEDRPVEDWFNRFAPAVRSKAVVPAELDEAAALAAMIADPNDLVLGQTGSSDGDSIASNKAIKAYRTAAPSGTQGLKTEKAGGK